MEDGVYLDVSLQNTGVIRYTSSRTSQTQRMEEESWKSTGLDSPPADSSFEPETIANSAAGHFTQYLGSSAVARDGTPIGLAEVRQAQRMEEECLQRAGSECRSDVTDSAYSTPQLKSSASFTAGYFSKPSASSAVAAGDGTVMRLADVPSLRSTADYSASRSFFNVPSLRSTADYSASRSFFSNTESIPPSFNRYWDLTRARNLAVQKAADAVRTAYEYAYGDQIELWSQFMVAALRDGLVPHQPQATPARMVQLVGKSMEDELVRLVRFASLLHGFLDFGAEDQRSLLSTKYLISGMLRRATFIYRGEWYVHTMGLEKIHTGAYYMQAIEVDPEFCRFIYRFTDRLNDVGLTLTEIYMLLAVAIFVPEHPKVVDKGLPGALHAFYLDVLFYMLGSRLTIADRALAYYKLEKIMQEFPMIDRISLNFVSDLDVSRAPLRPRSITFVDSLLKSQ